MIYHAMATYPSDYRYSAEHHVNFHPTKKRNSDKDNPARNGSNFATAQERTRAHPAPEGNATIAVVEERAVVCGAAVRFATAHRFDGQARPGWREGFRWLRALLPLLQLNLP